MVDNRFGDYDSKFADMQSQFTNAQNNFNTIQQQLTDSNNALQAQLDAANERADYSYRFNNAVSGAICVVPTLMQRR